MFITFEGPDGSGKTTALNSLRKFLDAKGVEYVFTREPGGSNSRASKKLREVILDPKNQITDMAEAILYCADRRLNLELNIWPALKKNKLVLCDRYLDSTLAYQGNARGLGIEKMLDLQEIITEKTMPDLTVFFDISPKNAEKRVDERAPKDRLELAGEKFHKKVYKGYLKIAKMFPNRIVSVDASRSKTEVFDQVKEIILKKLEEQKK